MALMETIPIHKSGKGRNLKLPQLIDMAAQIAAGMAFLGKNYFLFLWDDNNNSIFVNLIVSFGYFRVAKLYSS